VKPFVVDRTDESREGVVVVITGHGHDVNIGRQQPLNTPLQTAEGLVHFVLCVHDVTGQCDGVHGLVDRRVDALPPHVRHGHRVVLDGHP